jgi:hypothetical protein
MEQATEKASNVELTHFKGLRRGFDNGDNHDAHFEAFVPFTPADFDWRVTDVHEYDRSAECTLIGSPQPHVVAHLEYLLTVCNGSNGWYNTVLRRDRHNPERFDNLYCSKRLAVEWHYKGCRNEEQKRKRRADALEALERARQRAFHLELDKLEACNGFNETLDSGCRVASRVYCETWVHSLTKGDRDEWVLCHIEPGKTDPRAEDVAVYRKEQDTLEALTAQIVRLKSQRAELRAAQHRRYNDLVEQRLEDDGWTDNEGKRLPVDVIQQVRATLAR